MKNLFSRGKRKLTILSSSIRGFLCEDFVKTEPDRIPDQPRMRRRARNKTPESAIDAGRVRSQASAIFFTVLDWTPVPCATMVPAIPEDRMCVVLTGSPTIVERRIVV